MWFEIQPRSPDLIITTNKWIFVGQESSPEAPKRTKLHHLFQSFACPPTPLDYFESTFFIG